MVVAYVAGLLTIKAQNYLVLQLVAARRLTESFQMSFNSYKVNHPPAYSRSKNGFILEQKIKHNSCHVTAIYFSWHKKGG